MSNLKASCTCGSIEVKMKDKPKIRGICHCGDCRELLNIPYHSVNAWEKEFVKVAKGLDNI